MIFRGEVEKYFCPLVEKSGLPTAISNEKEADHKYPWSLYDPITMIAEHPIILTRFILATPLGGRDLLLGEMQGGMGGYANDGVIVARECLLTLALI